MSMAQLILAIETEAISRGKSVPAMVISRPLTVKPVIKEVYSMYSKPHSSFPQRTGNSSTWIII